MTYEDLIIDAEGCGVEIVEKHFKSKAKGLCKGSKIGVNKSIDTDQEKLCVLAEELGHYFTTTGNILDQSDVSNQKQELRARRWAYRKLCPIENIVFALQDGHTDLWDMAEYLDVEERFLRDALNYYSVLF